jgi:hypothetical protein
LITFYDGHLVFGQSPAGVVIGIVPSTDGMCKLSSHQNLERVLADTSVCGKSFELQSDHLGTMYVCLADNECQWQLELEMRDIAETLKNEYDFNLRIIDRRYIRLVTVNQEAA